MSNQINGKIVLGLDTKKSAAQINSDLKKLQNQLSQAAESITKWLSLNTVAARFISQTQNAIKELKQVDTLLTQIGNTNERL
ncbi:MAG: hypothetical protein K2I07_13865, partial [Lachnospiraceae bacterium]|nr:hypothetical protein [Lachnospiraceae bacterium]